MKSVNSATENVNEVSPEIAAATGIVLLHFKEQFDRLTRAIHKKLYDDKLSDRDKLRDVCAATVATVYDLNQYIDDRLAVFAEVLSASAQADDAGSSPKPKSQRKRRAA